jgi:hypothetical protein
MLKTNKFVVEKYAKKIGTTTETDYIKGTKLVIRHKAIPCKIKIGTAKEITGLMTVQYINYVYHIPQQANITCKSKAVPLQAMEAHGRRGCIAPIHT